MLPDIFYNRNSKWTSFYASFEAKDSSYVAHFRVAYQFLILYGHCTSPGMKAGFKTSKHSSPENGYSLHLCEAKSQHFLDRVFLHSHAGVLAFLLNFALFWGAKENLQAVLLDEMHMLKGGIKNCKDRKRKIQENLKGRTQRSAKIVPSLSVLLILINLGNVYMQTR